MKFGVHAGLWMARWTYEVAPILRIVADLGFDGVEGPLLGMTDNRAANSNADLRLKAWPTSSCCSTLCRNASPVKTPP